MEYSLVPLRMQSIQVFSSTSPKLDHPQAYSSSTQLVKHVVEHFAPACVAGRRASGLAMRHVCDEGLAGYSRMCIIHTYYAQVETSGIAVFCIILY